MIGVLPYFPKISVFQRFVQEGRVVIFPELPYDKKWQINRMTVPGSNGLINLSIPISGGRNCKLRLDQVEIDNRYHWQRDHFRTLSSVYGRSPFFSFYAAELELLMNQPYSRLLDWNMACFDWVSQKMKFGKIIPVSFVIDAILNKNEIKNTKHEVDVHFPVVYNQVFEHSIGFHGDVSILDLLFNQGANYGKSIIGFSA